MPNQTLHYSNKNRCLAIFAVATITLMTTQPTKAAIDPYYCPSGEEEQDNSPEIFRNSDKQYDRYSCFSEGLSAVTKDSKHGFVNNKIEEVIPLQYESASMFSNGVASVSILVKDEGSFLPWAKVEKYGFIDKNNQWVIPPTYDYAGSFFFGRAVVGKKSKDSNNDDIMKYGYIDTKDKVIIPYQYDHAGIFLRNSVNGYEAESTTNKNNKIIEAQVTKIENGVQKTYLINTAGELTLPIGSEDNNPYFSEGLARVKVKGKEGFVNRKGEFVIPATYLIANPFRGEGQPTSVRDSKTGNWGFIDTTGKQVLPFVYYHAHSFENGKASITEADGRTRYHINIKGDKVPE